MDSDLLDNVAITHAYRCVTFISLPYACTNNMAELKVDVLVTSRAHSSLEFVALSDEIYNQLFPLNDRNVDGKFISVKFVGSNIFSTPKVYPITIKDDLNENEIELESMSILEKFSANFTIDTAIVKRIDKLPKLNHIYVSFPPEVYSILRTKPQECIHDLFCKERESSIDFAIVRVGDISHTLNGTVMFCEPYEQGYIDASSVITILKGENTDSVVKQPKNIPLNLDGLLEGQYIDFNVSTLEKDTLRKYTQAFTLIPSSHFEDEILYAALPFDEFQKLRCFSGAIMKLKINNTEIYIRVFPFDEPSDFSASIYLSPLLLLMLENPKKISVTSVNSQKHEKFSNIMPLACDVTLARVATPTTTDKSLQNMFLANLKTYFESAHRVITKGALIPIPLDTALARTLNHTYGSKGYFPGVIPEGDPDSIAWFMVTDGFYKDKSSGKMVQMEAVKQYFVNFQKTRMLQTGTIKLDMSTVDHRSMKKYLGIPTFFPYCNVIQPGNKVTFAYAKSLRKIYETSIKTRDKVKLQTAVLLTSSTRFIGKTTLVRSISEEYGYSVAELEGFELLNDGMNSPAVTIGLLRGKLDKLVDSCQNLTILIKHIDALCKKGDDQQVEQKSTDDVLSLQLAELIAEYTLKGIIFIGTTNDPDNLNDVVRSKMKFEFDITVPNEPERREIFNYLLFDNIDKNTCGKYLYKTGPDVDIGVLALQSAALTPNDIGYVVQSVRNHAFNRLKKESKVNKIAFDQLIDITGSCITMNFKDFEKSINKARNKFSDSIGAPRIPNVKWEDVGGLDVVKNEILDTIEMPLKHPELFGSGMKKRSGLLFYGPPGTGKTLLAKAIATNFSLNFFSVKGPELLNMYIGESEANVRRVFEKARDAKPCVIFFDELDSVAPRRGNQGDSGGVMDRIVSQLLAELDGMSGTDGGDGVFVVGASNRPDLLDEALLRPGRFDKMLYLGISDTHEKQAKIIEALSRKFNLDPNINLQQIAETCPFNFTGADFYALCSDSMLNAMIRTAGEVDKKLENYNLTKSPDQHLNLRQWFDKVATDGDLEVVVRLEDFQKARSDLVASVSEEELQHYLRVRENFEGVKK